MILACLLTAFPAPQELIDGRPYVKLDTRDATRERMLQVLLPERAAWGAWYQLGPFPYAGHGRDDLSTPHAPELELPEMEWGGAGPDLTAEYAGKNGAEARWEPLGHKIDEVIDMHRYEGDELSDFVTGYLYTTIVAASEMELELSMGSDDGLRFWLNAKLLLDRDIPRGLDPEADRLTLPLREGLNHLLVKVVDGQGGWGYQALGRRALVSPVEVELSYLLDRDFPPSPEREFWRVSSFPTPEGLVLEVGGLSVLSDGRPVVATRRGDVLLVENAYDEPPIHARYSLFASGLHEPLGCEVRFEAPGEVVYTVQRGELTRLVDENDDGRADLYESFCNDWGVSGNYHEFAFGPKFDAQGNAWVTLNVGFCGSLGKSTVPWRGWALKVNPQGEMTPVCCGLRSPNGIGSWTDGEMFYVENQGDYVATNRLTHLAQGSWHGHPSSLRWREDLEGDPPRQKAAVWFPYRKMGQSAADVVLDETRGSFGPFNGQMLVGDQTHASVMRVWLEEVEGEYQGVCFPFLSKLDCGVNRMCFLPDGSLLIGETARGWGSIGRKPFGLQRVVWSGVTPFEIRTMRSTADGFELEFTLDLNAATAEDPDSYRMSSYTYEYRPEYGAPESDVRQLEIRSARMIDRHRVRLVVDPLREGYVHELAARGVRTVRKNSAGENEALLHPMAYYTLQRIMRQ